MSEDEKEAIKFLINFIDIIEQSIKLFDEPLNVKCSLSTYNAFNTILSLIDKQQKEIEELKKYEEYYEDMEEVNKKFISVDKIKARIEYLQDNFSLSEMIWNTQDILDELKELLGE